MRQRRDLSARRPVAAPADPDWTENLPPSYRQYLPQPPAPTPTQADAGSTGPAVLNPFVSAEPAAAAAAAGIQTVATPRAVDPHHQPVAAAAARRSEPETVSRPTAQPTRAGTPWTALRPGRRDIAAVRPGRTDRLEPAGGDGTHQPTARPLPRGFLTQNAGAIAYWAADPAAAAVRPVFFSAGGGVGVSTVTAATGTFLAAVNHHPVIAAELGKRSCRSLCRWVTGDLEGSKWTEWAELARRIGPEEALSHIPAGPAGLVCANHVEAGPAAMAAVLPGGTSILADAGSLDAWPDLPASLVDPAFGATDAVMVARADSSGVDSALAAIGAIKSTHPSLDIVMVLNDLGGFGGPTVRSAAKLAAAVVPTVTVPLSESLRQQPIRVDQLDKNTAAAITALMRLLIDRSWRRSPGPPPPPTPVSAVTASHPEPKPDQKEQERR